MVMDYDILVTIKPTFGNKLVSNGKLTPFMLRAVRENRVDQIFFAVMDELDKMKERLLRYFEDFAKILKDRDFRDQVLTDVGTKIINYARENAETGYVSGGILSEVGVQWEQRAELTKRLYTLKGYDPNSPGLYAARNSMHDNEMEASSLGRFIESLSIGTDLNIFLVKPDVGIVILGTRFRFARVLEEGGTRFGSHLGIREDWSPTKWLLDALVEVEGLTTDEAWTEAFKIRDQLIEYGSLRGIPPRPYLKPALYYVYNQDEAIEIICKLLGNNLKNIFENMPIWSQVYDKLSVTVSTGGIIL